MLTVYSESQTLHRGGHELCDGDLLPCFEKPERATLVLDAVRDAHLGDVSSPDAFGIEPLLRVHDRGYLEFLQSAWDQWTAEGRTRDALPYTWAVRGMRPVVPEHIDGKLAWYSFDAGTPITAGTWAAASAATDVALTGASRLLAGDRAVFSLCRPPGHHAAADCYGGYCFMNNAAIAAQYLIDNDADNVAILDIDYHHGNGTQSIFYSRSDVLFVSIHGDPLREYPFFLGHRDEFGEGEGRGFTANFPLQWQCEPADWFAALDAGLRLIRDFAPRHLVVSLGVDTFIDDPISQFRLRTEDYLDVGDRIAALGLPTLFVLEGGYATNDLGRNVVNVLSAAARAAD